MASSSNFNISLTHIGSGLAFYDNFSWLCILSGRCVGGVIDLSGLCWGCFGIVHISVHKDKALVLLRVVCVSSFNDSLSLVSHDIVCHISLRLRLGISLSNDLRLGLSVGLSHDLGLRFDVCYLGLRFNVSCGGLDVSGCCLGGHVSCLGFRLDVSLLRLRISVGLVHISSLQGQTLDIGIGCYVRNNILIGVVPWLALDIGGLRLRFHVSGCGGVRLFLSISIRLGLVHIVGFIFNWGIAVY